MLTKKGFFNSSSVFAKHLMCYCCKTKHQSCKIWEAAHTCCEKLLHPYSNAATSLCILAVSEALCQYELLSGNKTIILL